MIKDLYILVFVLSPALAPPGHAVASSEGRETSEV